MGAVISRCNPTLPLVHLQDQFHGQGNFTFGSGSKYEVIHSSDTRSKAKPGHHPFVPPLDPL
eukprot:6604493-Pyramimonas_sp.AAC.1